MRATASLYTRFTGRPYDKVEFKNGRPIPPRNYDGAYYLRVSKGGKRRWISYKSLDEALVQQANFETNFDRARKGIPPLPLEPLIEEEPVKGTIAAAVAEFIKYTESRENDWRNGADNGLSPNSVEAYRKAVQDFASACAEFGAVQMAEFQDEERGEAILLNFKNWLRNNVPRKKEGKGAYSDMRKFVIVGQFLARNGIKMKADRTFNPHDTGLVAHADVPRVKKPGIADVVYYTPADLKAMLAAADGVHEKSFYRADDLRDLIFILLCTGMRDEEVQHLCWSDIQWANGDGRMRITVQDKPQFDWRVKDHERRIVLPDKSAVLQAQLKARLAGRDERAVRASRELLFCTNRGTPDQNFADKINLMQERAEDKGYAFSRPEARKHILHNFRKSYATYQMLQGIPARNIQRDLGHSELNTTERYLAVVDEPVTVRKAYEAIK